MTDSYFQLRPESTPIIYAYGDSHPDRDGLLKIGQTGGEALARIAQQYPTVTPTQTWKLVWEGSAMRNDGSVFTDHDVHRYLRSRRVENPAGEWFRCTQRDVAAAVLALQTGTENVEQRTLDFSMRPEQSEAVHKTAQYFRQQQGDGENKAPHFLWNAKMRFGKTFATYQLAKEMGWTRILVMTFKPAVQSAWETDLKSHMDFEHWQFVSRNGLSIDDADESRPIVCFGSFQDFLGRNSKTGGIKTQNEWVHIVDWDCVVFDEYHFGAWNDKSKSLFSENGEEETGEVESPIAKDQDILVEEELPISTDAFLYLSGTPFRAIATGEFIEDQIYNWTYTDEQRAKANWDDRNGDNPYTSVPRMVMMTYQLPERVTELASKGEFNQFDLNTFFEAKGQGDKAKFTYAEDVQKWLNIIRGADMYRNEEDLKLGPTEKPKLPFADRFLVSNMSHTLWFLPSVASCFAMKNLLDERQNVFFRDYKTIVAAGIGAGSGVEALPPVEKAMGDPLQTKTITLSCGKLTTGVTVKPWTGIFMLRNSSTPETYFQAAFRVQSPWSIPNPDRPNEQIILKQNCYVFDFAPNRALRLVADYAEKLNVENLPVEDKVAEFVSFLPVLAYDGSTMKAISPGEILDIASSGTTATLLARRWQSALLVNVDNDTLRRIMHNAEALEAISNIEGFRTLGENVFEAIVNKAEAVAKKKRDTNDGELTPKEKKELTDEEKEIKSLRKQVQEKLIKFATRIPIFMYLTDYRERTLMDVITQLEPGLFKTVTGITSDDFGLLLGLGVFNRAHMNDAVGKFKRYEDSSLEYVGINKHAGEAVGLFDTVMSERDYTRTFKEEPAEYSA